MVSVSALPILIGVDIILSALIAALICVLVLLGAAWFVMRRVRLETRQLAKRVYRLPMRYKLALATGLMRDERLPLGLRLLPPALILYLALPLDIIPDFIPVIGQVDDVLVLLVGGALLLRFAPVGLLDERISELEAAAAGDRAA